MHGERFTFSPLFARPFFMSARKWRTKPQGTSSFWCWLHINFTWFSTRNIHLIAHCDATRATFSRLCSPIALTIDPCFICFSSRLFYLKNSFPYFVFCQVGSGAFGFVFVRFFFLISYVILKYFPVNNFVLVYHSADYYCPVQYARNNKKKQQIN